MRNSMKVLSSMPALCLTLLFGVDAIAVTPTELAELLPNAGDAVDSFGRSVALDGDMALISAPRDDELGTNSGAVYAFRFDGTNWN